MSQETKAFLEAQLLGRCFQLHTEGLDKYGRVLVRVKLKLGWMDEVMVRNGHAVRYDGGTKAAFEGKSDALVRPKLPRRGVQTPCTVEQRSSLP